MNNKEDCFLRTEFSQAGRLQLETFKSAFPLFDKKNATKYFNFLDKFFQANLARLSAGISPAEASINYFSWITQLMECPGHQLALICYPYLNAKEYIHRLFFEFNEPSEKKDVRFHSDSWNYLPWHFWAETFLQIEKWWGLATVEVPGLPRHIERRVSFFARQILDALSPSNFIFTNPDLFYETLHSGGYNLVRGTELAIEHTLRRMSGDPPPGAENFIPGKDVAITPGRIVYQNYLIELIQYEPQTKSVYKEPILIIPAWIMKYYILDLSPNNSFAKWFVQQGHTVFMISWRNPDSKDRNLSMDDYYRIGAMAAIDKVHSLFPKNKINLIGYCLGGTLAMITAAAMSKNKDARLNSLTLLAAQGDFDEPGELMIFVTPSEVAFLKNMMWDQGYLDTKQMAGAFQLLRSYDLIWSKMIQDYMHGRHRGMIDLLAWNADATRMPYKMHSEYLEKLFLRNEFSNGDYKVEGEYVAPTNIHLPSFLVSTEKDHVAPWQSVYKAHLMFKGDITFVLASGGHNAGIVSEPGHKGRYYRIRKQKKRSSHMNAKNWFKTASKKEGSWWNSLDEWLAKMSSKERITAPKLDKALPPAPGVYVHQK